MNENVRKNLLTFLLSISMVCLVFSKYVLSMSLIGILLVLFFTKQTQGGFSLGLNPKIYQRKTYSSLWPFSGFVIFFFWVIISIFWSNGYYTEWFHDVQSKLSILGIAVIFALLPKLENFRIVLLHQVFGGTILIALLLVLYVYIPSYEDITFRIGKGRPIPTPIDHVRFSIMVAYACLSFLALILESVRYGLRQKEKLVMAALSLIFFGFCHLLAVRTGLILLLLLAIALVPFIAYHTVESFRNKVYYTKYDIEQVLSNKGTNYSDGDRIRSIQHGIYLWKQHPIMGHGAGEYKKAVLDYHIENNIPGRVLLPHNEYVRAGMAYGWIGLILLLSGFGLVLIRRRSWTNLPLLLILLLLLLSLFVESNLERYYALAFFMLFIGINSKITQN